MTVKIIRFDFQNGFTYRRCHIPLDDQGLVLLQGKNGHGKSTPFEILEHTFYGDTSRGLKKSAILCTIPREDPKEETGFLSEVELERDCGSNLDGRWLLRESRGHGKYGTAYRVLRDVAGKWKDQWEGGGCPKGLEDARKFGAKLLGLRQNEFEGCLYLSQSGTHTLIEGKPSEKLLYLSYLFGVDRYDAIQKALLEKSKANETKLLGVMQLEAKVETLRSRLREYYEVKVLDLDIKALTLDLKVAEDNLSRQHVRRDAARDAVKTGEQRKTLQEELELLHQYLPDLEKSDAEVKQIEKVSTLRDELRANLKDAEQRDLILAKIKALGDVPDEDYEESLQATQHDLNEAEQVVKGAAHRQKLAMLLADVPEAPAVPELTDQISFVEKNLEVKRSKYRERLAEYKELEQQVTEFKTGVCPTCRRPMDVETMKSRLLALTDETNALYAEIQKPKQKLADLKATLEHAQRREDLTKQMADLPTVKLQAAVTREEESKKELARLQDLYDRQHKLQTLKSMPALKSVTASQDDLNERMIKADQMLREYQAVEKKLSQYRAVEKQMAKLPEVDVEKENREIEIVEKAAQEIQGEIKAVQAKLTTAESSRSARVALEREIAVVDEELSGLSDLRRNQSIVKWATTVVPKLKKRKIHKIICAIRDVLPRYAGTMFSHEPNTKFVVEEDEKDESIDLIARRMVDVGGQLEPALINVKGFSGGEKQRLSVALLFTLHSLLDPTKRPDLLILDEVDKALDDLGIASLMSLVSEAKEQYGTVIMTSHRSQINGAHFEKVWRVEKVNETSTFYLDQER